ncbi:sulfatase [Candidatus Poribacteria bacterium]|nr:sulfatase [Candidatus Poribacteria bacterium]
MNDLDNSIRIHLTRRAFLQRCASGIGSVALTSLLAEDSPAKEHRKEGLGILGKPHFPPKAKRVIFICQSGGVSQFETFDFKPKLMEFNGQAMPASFTAGERLAQIRGHKLIVCGSPYAFARHGQCGAEISELLPHIASIVDDICIVRTCVSEAINHDPAVTFLQCGGQQPGRPTMGAWLSYGLGNISRNLPAFVVLCSGMNQGQNLHTRYWGSGFLPSKHQGVMFRPTSTPVPFVNNPAGIDRRARRRLLDSIMELNRLKHNVVGDPEIDARISAYEMAFQMQSSVPDLMDISSEPQCVLDMYGPEVHTPGSAARSCLLARRLAERGVRFVQLYHRGWDQHGNLPQDLSRQCQQTDQPSAALIKDLKMRGLLDDTLVIWGTEFGSTPMLQGEYDVKDYGRDHHMLCFSMWMAGAGIQPGLTYGESDEFGYRPVNDSAHIHDLHATWLHLLGIDHERLTYSFQGRDYRLTDVHGKVMKKLLA